MIRHTVAFRLIHPAGSAEEAAFLQAAAELADIPGVQKFEVLREVSPKNDFAFGLSMEFDDQAAYDAYSFGPKHSAFVTERWQTEVADFLEVDYVPFTAS
ncbi:Dabb family protein [Gryllotalpicola kribbensis]|uniref:Dabb family protein n=1 Tax=Gryllotalpicola kribbensis TaxID=993084 RepID=A0ABP8AK01_9MICO